MLKNMLMIYPYYFKFLIPINNSIPLTHKEPAICIDNFTKLSKPTKSGVIIPAENQAIDKPFKKSDKNFR